MKKFFNKIFLFFLILHINLIFYCSSNQTKNYVYNIKLNLFKNESEELIIFTDFIDTKVDFIDPDYFTISKKIDSFDSTIFVFKIKKYGKTEIFLKVADLNIVIKYIILLERNDNFINLNDKYLNQADYYQNFFVSRMIDFFQNNIFIPIDLKLFNEFSKEVDISNFNPSFFAYLGLYNFIVGNFKISSSYFALIKDYFLNIKKEFQGIDKNKDLSKNKDLKNISYFENKLFYLASFMLSKIHILIQNKFIASYNFEQILDYYYNNNLDYNELDRFLIILIRSKFLDNNFEEIIEISNQYMDIIKNSKYCNYFYYIIGYSYFYKKPPDFKNAYFFLKLVDKNFVNYNIVRELIEIIEKNKLNN
jgi:hypothetical protein